MTACSLGSPTDSGVFDCYAPSMSGAAVVAVHNAGDLERNRGEKCFPTRTLAKNRTSPVPTDLERNSCVFNFQMDRHTDCHPAYVRATSSATLPPRLDLSNSLNSSPPLKIPRRGGICAAQRNHVCSAGDWNSRVLAGPSNPHPKLCQIPGCPRGSRYLAIRSTLPDRRRKEPYPTDP